MNCAWKELLAVIPRPFQSDVDKYGKETLQELRLRRDKQPQMVLNRESKFLPGKVLQDDINFCINAASKYSPWAAATIGKGYLTAPGGHRIGLCGEAVWRNGHMDGIRNVSSLCIRVARDFHGIGNNAPTDGSVLILGAPGWGKTTLLRDLIRLRSNRGIQVAVLDERGELFPENGFERGQCTDVLTGCSKVEGIHILLRTMGPSCIAVDEITQPEDCHALQQAVGCGVSLLATAHASSVADFKSRPVYRPLLNSGIFTWILVLRSDKTWHLERM